MHAVRCKLLCWRRLDGANVDAMHCKRGVLQLDMTKSLFCLSFTSGLSKRTTQGTLYADTLSTVAWQCCKQICITSMQTLWSHTSPLTLIVDALGELCKAQLMCRAGTGLMKAKMVDTSMAMSLKKQTMTSYLW